MARLFKKAGIALGLLLVTYLLALGLDWLAKEVGNQKPESLDDD